MHRSPKYRRKAWRRTSPATPGFHLPWSASVPSTKSSSARLTCKETIALTTLSIIALSGTFFLLNTLSDWMAQRNIENYLARLQVKYSLTQEQLAAVRRIESEYHGTGGIVFRPSHTHQEETDHHITISKQMSPDAAARFLADQKNNGPYITRLKH